MQSNQTQDNSLSESVTVQRSTRLRPICAVLTKNGLTFYAYLPIHAQPCSSHDWDLLCLLWDYEESSGLHTAAELDRITFKDASLRVS